ncbi:MAG: hypothetical protein Kow0049_01840 [Stanieria sp.]
MLVINLFLLAICLVMIFGWIERQDEIHQIVVFLSGLIALLCLLILSPPLIKLLVAIIIFFTYRKVLPISSKF